MIGANPMRRWMLRALLATLAMAVVAMAVPVWTSAQDKRARGTSARFGWVQIFTSNSADVTVDGKPYPKRSDNGLRITANERHEVIVKMGEKQKAYTIAVKPREKRIMMVDLSGYQTPPSPATAVSPSKSPTSFTPAETKATAGEEKGKLTVYSKPKGEVYVDGTALGATTPMINRELDLGRHEVQVKWESGDMSEVKTIRIRKGSKLKLFFRDRSNNNP
jgi:FtsP/CotA-like multicopper oxidase with cupredoxin domain